MKNLTNTVKFKDIILIYCSGAKPLERLGVELKHVTLLAYIFTVHLIHELNLEPVVMSVKI